MDSRLLAIGNYQIEPEKIVDLLATYQLLPQVWQQLRLDEATVKIEPTSEQIQQATEKWMQARQIASVEQLQTLLVQQNLTQQQWQAQMVRQLKISLFQQATWGEQLESYFLAHKAQLDRVVYSLIRTNDGALIQELYFRLIEAEESWMAIAGKYSTGVEAQTGGLIGPVELGKCHPAIAQQLRSAQVGRIYGPLKVQNDLILVRLERFIPASLDAPTRQRLLDRLMFEWLGKEWQKVSTPKT